MRNLLDPKSKLAAGLVSVPLKHVALHLLLYHTMFTIKEMVFFNVNNFILIAYEYFLFMESERIALNVTVLYFGITVFGFFLMDSAAYKNYKGIDLINLLKISAPVSTFKSFLQFSSIEGNLISLQKSQ